MLSFSTCLSNCIPARAAYRLLLSWGVLGAVLFLAVSPVWAVDSYAYTTFSSLQSVDSFGNTNYSGGTSISLIGVVINNPCDMTDYKDFYINSKYDAVEWQTFIQAMPGATYNNVLLNTTPEYGSVTTDALDYGGAALYIRANNPKDDSALKYTAETWGPEMDRVNCVNGDYTLSYGDVVQVTTTTLGMFYKGKFNVNEQHSALSDKDFSVRILGHISPTATTVTLGQLKDADNNFLFDSTRATGCEHYQGSLVHLKNLVLESDISAWAEDGEVTVSQQGQDGRTFTLKLGLDEDLFTSDIKNQLTSGAFSVTAILDQEDSGTPSSGGQYPGVPYYNGGYRLWLTNADQLQTVPEPSSMILLAIGVLVAAWGRKRLFR